MQGSCEVGVKLNFTLPLSYNALVINAQRYPVQDSCEVGVKLCRGIPPPMVVRDSAAIPRWVAGQGKRIRQ